MSKQMNIVFLDIDGVLNDWERSWREVPDYNPEFVPCCVKAFNKIIRATEAKIVLSSSWRYGIHRGDFSLRGFGRMLRSHSVRGELIGATRPSECDEPRWREIADWLKKPMLPAGLIVGIDDAELGVGLGLEKTTEPVPFKIKRYAIIDDDSDAFGGRPGVQTAGGVGLTEADADLVIEILTG